MLQNFVKNVLINPAMGLYVINIERLGIKIRTFPAVGFGVGALAAAVFGAETG